MQRLPLLMGVGSLVLLLGGSLTAQADTTDFVRLREPTNQVAVYDQLPRSTRTLARPQQRQVSKSAVFKVLQRQLGASGMYLKLAQLGWVRQASTIQLTHVRANGTLVIFKQAPMIDQVSELPGQTTLTLTTNGPIGTQTHTDYRDVSAKDLRQAHVKTTQVAWTDLGKFYQLQGHQVSGWVNASTVVLTTPSKHKKSATKKQVKRVQTKRQKVAKPTKNKQSAAIKHQASQSVKTKRPAKPTSTISTATMAKINALINQNHLMGTLLVTNSGPKGVQIQSYGEADVAKQQANTNNEAYPLASLQKAVTGALIQQLINRGKLRMTTPLAKFYPNVPYANQITIRELLDHKSGIQMGEPVPTSILPNEAAAVAFTLNHLTSTNDHVWHYSNANFTILAGIISKVTGQSYWHNVQTGIIKPLKLRNMYLYNQIPARAVTPLSYTYTATGSVADPISDPLLSSELGCGNLYASVGDYYTVIYNLLAGHLVGLAGLAQLSDQAALQYSGGIYYQANQRVRIGGADNSFHTVYEGTNNGRVGVVLFTNQSRWKVANAVAVQILQLINPS
ncbi:serine hydrolase domain-containing protein [Lactiplantibacillus brownii]|uniref:serine hydrolase domain-containing protein n=1 Tax=Lactiplantibacillus brownii TaxID=3069269 RepID=UPI0038B2B429